MFVNRDRSWVVNQWVLVTTDTHESTMESTMLADVVFQDGMRAAGMLLHDSAYQRTLSSKKNAMHEEERFCEDAGSAEQLENRYWVGWCGRKPS